MSESLQQRIERLEDELAKLKRQANSLEDGIYIVRDRLSDSLELMFKNSDNGPTSLLAGDLVGRVWNVEESETENDVLCLATNYEVLRDLTQDEFQEMLKEWI